MTTPRPALLGIVVALLLISTVSADVIIDDDLIVKSDTSTLTGEHKFGTNPYTHSYNTLTLTNIQNRQNLGYISMVFAGNACPTLISGENKLSYTLNGQTKPCTVYVNYQKNYANVITSTKMSIFFDGWDVGSLTGNKDIIFSKEILRTSGTKPDSGGSKSPNAYWTKIDGSYWYYPNTIESISIASFLEMKNHITVENQNNYYNISLTREYPEKSYASRFEVLKSGTVVFYNEDVKNYQTVYSPSEIDEIKIILGTNTYQYPTSTPTNSTPVLVHIVALDARNENLLLAAAVEVRDQTGAVVATGSTSPNGWYPFTYDLPANLTDEDFQRHYSVNITLPGWTQKVPAMKFYPAFIPRSGDWIRVEMLPDSSGPADPGKTYLMFYVRDTAANPLSDAFIEINGEYWKTNSAGHIAVEVPKNATYPYVVRKTGYMTISGSATVEGENSYTVNVCLGKGAVPTNPPATSGPGDTPGPGPTPDRRTNEEKGQAVVDMLADNAEGIGALALICLLVGLLKLMVKW